MSVATATVITGLAVAAGTAGGMALAAHESGNAAKDAAKTTGDAQTSAAKLQTDATKAGDLLTAQGNADTLAYTKQQALQTQANFNTTQKANYDQWASGQNRLGTLGQAIGLGPRNIPAYVPPTDLDPTPPATGTLGAPLASGSTAPSMTTLPPGGTLTAPGATPPANLADPKAWMSMVSDPKALSSWVSQGLGPGADPSLVNYYVGKIQGQPGANAAEQAGGASYWLGKLKAGATPAPAAAPVAAAPVRLQTLGSGLQQPALLPVSGNLALPQPGTLGAYYGAR